MELTPTRPAASLIRASLAASIKSQEEEDYALSAALIGD